MEIHSTCASRPVHCPQLSASPHDCVTADGLLVPILVDGSLIGADVDLEVLATVQLPEGTRRHARIAPTVPTGEGSCDDLVVPIGPDLLQQLETQPLRSEASELAAAPVAADGIVPMAWSDHAPAPTAVAVTP